MEYEIEDDPQGNAERIGGDRDGGLEEDQQAIRKGRVRPIPHQFGEKFRESQLS